MRWSLITLALAACSDDVEVTRLPGSPSATRAITFFDDGQPIAIGGDSEFGLAYLQTPIGDTWQRADGVPAFDASAKLFRSNSDVFAIGETQLYRWDRASSGFAWTAIPIPIGVTASTAFAVDDLGHVFALELQADGAGAVWTWRTDTNRWQEIPMTRPIGIGATQFTISDSGNNVVWSVPGVGITWVDRITSTRRDLACEDLGTCAASVRGLAMKSEDVLFALVCDQEINGVRSLMTITADGVGSVEDFKDESCRSMSSVSYGTKLVVGDGVYILHNSDDGLVRITDADPELTYALRDPSTAFAYGDGIYRIDF